VFKMKIYFSIFR